MSGTSKEFSEIISDYEFFVRHSTEAQSIQHALAGILGALSFDSDRIKMADFGCGDGSFLAALLSKVGSISLNQLLLIDVVESYLASASSALEPFVRGGIEIRSALVPRDRATLELIISNHALYYVPDIAAEVLKITQALKPDGLFLGVLANDRNALIEFWKVQFGILGKRLPYNLNEDFRDALQKAKVFFEVREVESQLSFKDTEENRSRIARFLVGDEFTDQTKDAMHSYFDRFQRGENVVMQLVDEIFSVRPRRSS